VKFGRFALRDARGAILAHAVKQRDLVLKKGLALQDKHIALLAAEGIEQVIAAHLEPGDVTEDEAARRLAEASRAGNIRLDPPFTGRTNLFSERAGVLVIDAAAIDAANAVDDAITIATLPALKRVAAGEMIGTVKIIPFAVPEASLSSAIEAARGAIRVAPFQAKSIRVISTDLPGLKRSVIEKTLHVLRQRLENAGADAASIQDHEIVPHEEAALAAALKRASAQADIVIVFGASAITDLRDVIPSAIEVAGGSVDHFGMPVDPGNLLLIGRIGSARIIGAPGCARSPKENGFDWVLERFLADVPVTSGDIRKMGVGGLLMEIISRPQPRAPKIAALILAAGSSTRMGRNKLVEIWRGQPILRHAAEAAIASAVMKPVLLITGNEAGCAMAAVEGLDIVPIHNPRHREGLSTSLQSGVKALPESAMGVVVLLGDMPRISAALIDRLIAAFLEHPEAKAVVPLVNGQRGNPVLLSREVFAEVAALSGDQGARKLLERWGKGVLDIAIDDDAALADVDTPEAFAALPV
jgi:molybdenum cofactor cytidylyltransferase